MTFVEPGAIRDHLSKVTVFPTLDSSKCADGSAPQAAPGSGWLRPFVWREPSTIPQRQWLYGQHYIRKFVTTTVGHGGGGKSANAVAEAIAIVSGQPILRATPEESGLRVWYWNGEDPLEETERRIAAAALHYSLDTSALEAGLFIGSGREADLVIAEQTRDGVQIVAPNVEALRSLIEEHRIDLVIIDPFVASHRVTENDNNAVDRVAKTWAKLADETNTAIELIHHVRKGTAGQETTVEDGRGAIALLAAARSARVLNVMTEQEATNAGIDRRRSYFRIDNGKANLAPPPDVSSWFKFVSQSLGNGDDGGDSVGVVTPWDWPNHKDGIRAEDLALVQAKVSAGEWRGSIQSTNWVGNAIADALDLDLSNLTEKTKVKSLLSMWLKSGALKIEHRKDEKRNDRPFVVVGKLVSLDTETFK
jgi:hypothetical protein